MKHSLKPAFDGYIVVSKTEDKLGNIINQLKKKLMVNSRQLWIVGITDSFRIQNVLRMFNEGDKILFVGNKISEKGKLKENTLSQRYQIWSLHSPGNETVYLVEKNISSQTKLFDSRFYNFGGRVLRISSLGSPPIQVPPEPGENRWGGYIFEIINTMADFFNFTYVVKEAESRLYGMQQDDGTWSGMIGELKNGTVDMGVGDLSWSLERSTATDLTLPIFPESVTFIYRAPDFYSRTWILFQDIDVRAWVGLSSILLFCFSGYCLIQVATKSFENNLKSKQKPLNDMMMVAATKTAATLYRGLLAQTVEHIPYVISCRLLVGTWFLGAFVLNALYGGSLTSTLSQHRTPRPVDTMADLLKRHPDAMVAVRNNSFIHSYFVESESWRGVWLQNMKDNVIPGKLRIHDTMIEVHKKRSKNAPIYVWLAERSMLAKLMHKYTDDKSVCDLYVAKESLLPADWSLALVQNSPYLHQFNEILWRLKEFGILQKWSADYWSSGLGECRPTDGVNPAGLQPIRLNDAQAAFLILSLGWTVALITLIIERNLYI